MPPTLFGAMGRDLESGRATGTGESRRFAPGPGCHPRFRRRIAGLTTDARAGAAGVPVERSHDEIRSVPVARGTAVRFLESLRGLVPRQNKLIACVLSTSRKERAPGGGWPRLAKSGADGRSALEKAFID